MAEITAQLVKTLREMTGAGMMECKNALVAAQGDIERAVDDMRKSGQAKAAKKAGRIAAEGVIVIRSDAQRGTALMIEINCETDFVAKDANFIAFCDQVADQALSAGMTHIDALKEACEPQRVALVAKLGENITLRRLSVLTGATVSHYRHDTRIGVIVATRTTADETLLRQVAMHIAASKPEYINPQDIPTEVIERERQVQLALAVTEHERELQLARESQSEAPKSVEKIVQKQLLKFTNGLALTAQPFVMNASRKVGDLLQAKAIEITGFMRFEVGEGLEKATVDFAAEVAAVTQPQ